jgi:hypothetical protein
MPVRKDRIIPSDKQRTGVREECKIKYIIREAETMKKKNGRIVFMVFKAAAMAMGAAVVITNIIGGLDAKGQVLLLGIGLFCLSITALNKE